MKVRGHPIQSGGVGDDGIEDVRDPLPPHSKCAATFHLLDSGAGVDAPYGDNFEVEKSHLSLENTRFWQLSSYPKTT